MTGTSSTGGRRTVDERRPVVELDQRRRGWSAEPPAVRTERSVARRRPRASIAGDPGRDAAGQVVGRVASDGGWSSQAVSMVGVAELVAARPARAGSPTLVVSPRIAVSSSAATSARRAASRSGPCAITLPSIGSYDVLTTTCPVSSAASTRAPRRPAHERRRAGLRQEPAERVLGVDPGLDRVAVEAQVVLAERQRLAGGDPQLELDQVERLAVDGHHQLGDRVLDLEPGVHLQEVDTSPCRASSRNSTVPAFVVADLRGQRDRRAGDTSPDAARGDRRRRAPPRAPSGAAAGSSSRARRGARRCRGRRRAPAPRCAGRARRTSRPASCRRRTPTLRLAPGGGDRRRRTPRRRGRCACPCRRRRRRP